MQAPHRGPAHATVPCRCTAIAPATASPPVPASCCSPRRPLYATSPRDPTVPISLLHAADSGLSVACGPPPQPPTPSITDATERVYRFCHGSVDTPFDGVDTGASTRRETRDLQKRVWRLQKGKKEQSSAVWKENVKKKRRGERIKHQHPEREQSSAIKLRSRRAAMEEEELAIQMPLKQSIVD
ncbi:hypothetical protein Taro_053383, partial [Colocasia esculenta]|nr:hypothetical protein [Colocasia esculenta]